MFPEQPAPIIPCENLTVPFTSSVAVGEVVPIPTFPDDLYKLAPDSVQKFVASDPSAPAGPTAPAGPVAPSFPFAPAGPVAPSAPAG